MRGGLAFRPYWLLTYEDDPRLSAVEKYVYAGFDIKGLLTGKPVSIPTDMKILVRERGASDFLASPMSIPIVSKRLLDAVLDILPGDSQVLPAPLFSARDSRAIQGFSVLNPLGQYDVAFRLSEGAYEMDFERTPRDVHLFRAEGMTFLVASAHFMKRALRVDGIRGIEPLEIRATPVP